MASAMNTANICHVNAQSLLAHLDEFRTFFEDSRFHIICVSETWLKPSIPDQMISLRGYHILRQDRVGKIGGGVAIYLQNQLRGRILEHSDNVYCRKPEFLMAEISTDLCSKFLLTVVYRPPHCGYLSDILNIIADRFVLYKHTLVLGDFNADLDSCSYDSELIKSFANSVDFYLVPYAPTHHTRSSATRLDLCMIDDVDKLISYGQQDVGFLSSHDLIYVEYRLGVGSLQERSIWVRDFRSFDSDRFLSELDSCDWNALYEIDNVDGKVGMLNEYLLGCFDKHAPHRKIKPRHLPAPWLSDVIRKKMAERDRARRRWRRYRTDINYEAFKVLRNQTQLMVRNAKSRYYSEIFQDLTNGDLVWRKLRHLGLIKSKRVEEGLCCSVEELNNYFSGPPASQDDIMADNGVYYIGEEEYSDDKLYWKHIEPLHIVKALKDIKSNAAGEDGLSPVLLRIALPSVLPAITHIFNFCLDNGVYPTLWKKAIVSPIPKVKCPSELRDYRPISILCAISKSFERIVADQIKEYLESTDILDPYQFAYRRGHSTQAALVRVLDDVRQAADSRKVTVLVSFDFTKAFDNVCHKILIDKLRSVNFSCAALRWICAYLHNRRQAVRDPATGAKSSDATIPAGVPQGSVLGPLFFVLYLIGFISVLKYCKYNFYADDLAIYIHTEPRCLSDAINRINQDISRIVDWATANKLTLNPIKTKAIIIGTARYINELGNAQLPCIKVNDDVIPYSDSIVLLGLSISSTLSWERQVTGTVSRVNGALHRLKVCKHLLPLALRARLVSVLILPFFDYCCSALTDITGEQNLRLQRALNACVRFIYQAGWDEHVTPYYNRLRWLKVHMRRNYFTGNMMFSILHSGIPSVLFNGFEYRCDVVQRDTRACKDDLLMPLCRTEFYKRSFRCSAVELWNGLPSEIRNSETQCVFRAKLYEYLFNSNA